MKCLIVQFNNANILYSMDLYNIKTGVRSNLQEFYSSQN